VGKLFTKYTPKLNRNRLYFLLLTLNLSFLLPAKAGAHPVIKWTTSDAFEQKVFTENKGQFELPGKNIGSKGVTPPVKLAGNGNLVKVDSSAIDPKISALLKFYDKQIYFTENKGQWPDTVLYKADFPLGQALVTLKGMIVGTYDANAFAARNAQYERREKAEHDGTRFNEDEIKVPGHGWLMNFVNHSDSMHIEGKTKHSDYFNYFIGKDASKYSTNVSSCQEIWYKNVYNNVDVRYYPSPTGTLEYDIVCKPGFDKNNIAIQLTGIDKMYLENNGHLVLETSVGNMEFPSPVAYQKINGIVTIVEAKYVLRNNVLSFEIGNYNETQPLIIDPIALRWATWMTNNSSQANHDHCIWVDQNTGYIYVVARVASSGLITVNAIQNIYQGNGSDDENEIGEYIEPNTIGGSGQRVWQTYLGSAGENNPYALEQANNGDLIFTGYTESADYPLLGGTYYSGSSINDAASNGNEKIFITKINTAGNSFKSAVIGGNGNDESFDIRTTSTSDILVCGNTSSSNLATVFPGSSATNTSGNGQQDVIVFRINNNLDAITWMRNYGGTGINGATIMNTNQTTGDIFVAGTTYATNFPTTNPRQATLVGVPDGFIQKLDAGGNIVWSSYFQAAAGKYVQISAMELNTTQTSFYFAGLTTGLAAPNISASNVIQPNIAGATDYFVAKMDTNQNFDEATYLGAGGEAEIMGLNTDLNNNVYILGYTSSINFPVTSSTALQSTNLSNGQHNETFTELRNDLDSLDYSTYYGGSVDDYDPIGERGIKFFNCRIFTVFTSESDNVPLTAGAITTTKLSPSSIYEPGIAVWANPPDLANNTITGNQQICIGTTPFGGFTGSAPSYVLPNISRNNVTSSYPVALNPSTTYQWQYSVDSINWTNVPGGITQSLDSALIGSLTQTTYFRRMIGGDACVIAGSDQVIKVTVNPNLLIAVAVPAPICAGSNITLTASGGTTYTWTPSTGLSETTGSSVTANPTITTTYTITGTNGSGCTATTTVTVTVNPSLVIAVSTPLPICSGNSTILTANGASIYTWTPSTGLSGTTGSSVTANPTTSTTYTIIANTSGCTATTTVAVIVNPNPVIAVTTPASICSGSNTILAANGASTYTWTPSTGLSSSSGSSVTANPTSTTTYSITGTNASGCSATKTVTVTINPNPVITAATPAPICNGSSTKLTANGASTYAWTPSTGLSSSTGSSVIANPTTTTTYKITGTNASGCSATKTVAVIINTNPVIAVATPVPICSGKNTILVANGASTYTWIPTSGLSASIGSSVTANPTITTTYSITGTNTSGCTAATTVAVIVNPNPVITVATPAPICSGSSTMLAANGASTYTWTPSTGLSSSSGSSVTANPTATTTYTITAANTNGCTTATPVAVTVNPNPTIIVPPPAPICVGSSATLSANGASTYTWTPSTGLGATSGSSVEAKPITTITYTVTGSDLNGCIGTANVLVIVEPNPNVSVNTPPAICNGSSQKLTASGAEYYTWLPSTGIGATIGSSIIVNPTITTTYIVMGKNDVGCSSKANVQVLVMPAPTVSIFGLNPSYCINAPQVTLVGTPQGGTFYGNGVDSNQFNPALAGGAGTYLIKYDYTDSNGCKESTTTPVIVAPLPKISISPNNPTVCSGIPVTLSVSGASTYTWSPIIGLSDSTASNETVDPTMTTTYIITGTSSYGCSDTAMVTVNIDSMPWASFNAQPPNYCDPLTIQFNDNSTSGDNYNWDFGDGSSSADFNTQHTYNQSGNYQVKLIVTSPHGCVNDTVKNENVKANDNTVVIIGDAFTPNTNGINNIIAPNVLCQDLSNYVFRIYNRWGQLIFQTNDPTTGWDGRFNGQMQEVGVYDYYIEVSCGNCNIFKKGNITLLQ
jgi:gliding motility-associated-like protein